MFTGKLWVVIGGLRFGLWFICGFAGFLVDDGFAMWCYGLLLIVLIVMVLCCYCLMVGLLLLLLVYLRLD